MGLIVKETAKLANTGGVEITEFEVMALPFSGLMKSVGVADLKPQVAVYKDSATAYENLTNTLKIEGFPTNWVFEYKYGIDNVNTFYWMDLQIKAKLLETYPDWKDENIIVTSEIPTE